MKLVRRNNINNNIKNINNQLYKNIQIYYNNKYLFSSFSTKSNQNQNQNQTEIENQKKEKENNQENKLIIHNQLNKILWCMDTNDSNNFANLFTNNGSIEIIKINKTFQTHNELKNLCSNLYTNFYPALHFVSFFLKFIHLFIFINIIHLLIYYSFIYLFQESNIVIEFDEKDPLLARNKSYWYALHGNEIISTGFHFDEFIFTTNSHHINHPTWLFQRRIIRHHWTKNGGFEEVKI